MFQNYSPGICGKKTLPIIFGRSFTIVLKVTILIEKRLSLYGHVIFT